MRVTRTKIDYEELSITIIHTRMSGSTTTPVITGLACGIALVVLFSFLFSADATRSGISNNSGEMGEAATDNACLSKTLSSVVVNFPVKQPAFCPLLLQKIPVAVKNTTVKTRLLRKQGSSFTQSLNSCVFLCVLLAMC